MSKLSVEALKGHALRMGGKWPFLHDVVSEIIELREIVERQQEREAEYIDMLRERMDRLVRLANDNRVLLDEVDRLKEA